MNNAEETLEEDASVQAEAIQLMTVEHLPKLVELLQDVEPQYRQRLISAALVLLG